jgi:hypothetical protein
MTKARICAPVSSLGVFFSRLLINWPRRSALRIQSVARGLDCLAWVVISLTSSVALGPFAHTDSPCSIFWCRARSQHFRALNFCCCKFPLSAGMSRLTLIRAHRPSELRRCRRKFNQTSCASVYTLSIEIWCGIFDQQHTAELCEQQIVLQMSLFSTTWLTFGT